MYIVRPSAIGGTSDGNTYLMAYTPDGLDPTFHGVDTGEVSGDEIVYLTDIGGIVDIAVQADGKILLTTDKYRAASHVKTGNVSHIMEVYQDRYRNGVFSP